jgi:hypothetical protein
MQCHHIYDCHVQRSEEEKSNMAIATHSVTTPDELVNKIYFNESSTNCYPNERPLNSQKRMLQ